MKETPIIRSRTTKETQIEVELVASSGESVQIDTKVPFFDHMLTAMAFHGGFGLTVSARGDIGVDEHHLVEDVGLVLGDAFHMLFEDRGTVRRYGHSVIPMDDALAEVAIDVCERPFLVYRADYPQSMVGTFHVDLVKEFLYAFVTRARITLHAICRHGENSHHMAEALFKAFGKALNAAYERNAGAPVSMSTKGGLG